LIITLISSCSIPQYYLDIHYQDSVSTVAPFPIDIFITNARLGTTIYIESIVLSGGLAEVSVPYQSREGLYRKEEGSTLISAQPNRKLTQFETGGFPMTLQILSIGKLKGTLIFKINGELVYRDIEVDVN